MIKQAKKQVYRKYIILFFNLLLVGNIIHWKVVCFGADGHVEIESTFHEQCKNTQQHFISDKSTLSAKEGHDVCDHCEPCIDIPISNDLIQISNSSQKLNIQFPVLSTYILIDNDKNDSSLYNNIASNSFADTSYYDPLRTVILLV